MRTRVMYMTLLLTSCGLNPCAWSARLSTVPLTTPPGVTLRDVVGSDERLLWRYLADARGKALYTFDADGDSGRPRCTGNCTQEFPPYLAAANARAGGEWSLIVRGPQQQRQWVYRGHPLYYYSGDDPVPSHVAAYQFSNDFVSDKAAFLEAAALDPASRLYSPKPGWRRAAFQPEASTPVPSGIVLKSTAVANGYGFADQSTGMPLYVLAAAPKHPAVWTPMYAPDLAHRVGDFSIAMRADGRKQWAYKGQPLYSYQGDYVPDDLNGLLEQGDVRPALAYQHFMPPVIRIRIVPGRGPLMLTLSGASLYTETRYNDYGSSATPGGFRPDYEEGKAVGTLGCLGECLRTWKPLLATSQDQPSGFWEIQERTDGSRQWVYKGCALYTYAGDKNPGDIDGNNQVIIVYGDPEGKVDLRVTGGDRGPNVRRYAGSGFYWHVVSFYN